VIRVVAAVLCRSGKILLARRAPGKQMGGLWEFPGGKVEEGETLAAALAREMKEELGLAVIVGKRLMRKRIAYDFGEIELIFMLCRCADEGTLKPKDHDMLEWVAPERLREFRLAPGDVPVAERLSRGEWDALL
jgi:8-oxo-dGTP diphosphatase